MMRYFYLGLGMLLLIPAIVEAQIFDQVDVENWGRLVNQPVVIRTERGLLIDDHNFQALVADKKTNGSNLSRLPKGSRNGNLKSRI
jgi:hypothetical protein